MKPSSIAPGAHLPVWGHYLRFLDRTIWPLLLLLLRGQSQLYIRLFLAAWFLGSALLAVFLVQSWPTFGG